MEAYSLECDHISLGLTRPATQFGVPLVAFYFNVMASFLGWMVMESVLIQKMAVTLGCMALFLMCHLTMAWMTFKDPFGLRIFWLNLMSFRQHATFSHWNNTDSYAP